MSFSDTLWKVLKGDCLRDIEVTIGGISMAVKQNASIKQEQSLKCLL